MRILLLFCLSLVALVLFSQNQKARPIFSDYAVPKVYQGAPASPLLDKGQRKFRTMIRRGAKFPVEFAGHYTVPRWGCGAGCVSFVIVDSITGRVYDAPFEVEELPGVWEQQHIDNTPSRMDFHPDSRLMKINGCPNQRDCGFYEYVMVDGKGLKLLKKELLPKEFQY